MSAEMLQLPSFKRVKMYYESIVPYVRGKYVGRRPLGKRSRSFEYITKTGCKRYDIYGSYNTHRPLITWTIDDTYEYLDIYNDGNPIGYRLLENTLPRFCTFAGDFQSGVHYISVTLNTEQFTFGSGTVKYFIPRSGSYRFRRALNGQEDTGRRSFELVSDEQFPDTTRINKQDKAPYKKSIKSFIDDTMLALPWLYDTTPDTPKLPYMLSRKSVGITDRTYRRATEDLQWYYNVTPPSKTALTRSIILSKDDPRRVSLMIKILYDLDDNLISKPDISELSNLQLRTKINGKINKLCGFTYKHKRTSRSST